VPPFPRGRDTSIAVAGMDSHVDRDADSAAVTRVNQRPCLVFPLDTTVVTIDAADTVARLDRASFAIVPARLPYTLAVPAAGPIAVVTLVIGESACKAAQRDYAPDLDARRLVEVLASLRVLPRTRWVDELVHRYVFEREVCERPASKAARFLETELTKEVYFLGREQLDQLTRATVLFEGDSVAVRARAWIDEHLFEPFRIDALVEHCHASESTILRAFRKNTGVAPVVYMRRRRLEHALQLLESGRYAVTEVATRVGYDNPSAFAAAFHKQFGVTPSRVRPTAATLPAHGRPPRRRRRNRG
jgi:AraC-like DNA-binding protein